MAHYLLSAEAQFSAAHTLPGVDMCERMHGHNWRVRLTVRVDETGLDNVGMGVDFRTIEQLAAGLVADWEHRYLNDLEPFRTHPPTAEFMARTIAQRAQAQLATSAPSAVIEEVALWEMPQYRVVYRP